MTDTITSQNIDLSSWDTLYILMMHGQSYIKFLKRLQLENKVIAK